MLRSCVGSGGWSMETLVVEKQTHSRLQHYVQRLVREPAGDCLVSDDRPKRDTMTIEEAILSTMGERIAMVEVLEQKGLCPKQDRLDVAREVASHLGADAPCCNSARAPACTS